MLGQISGQTKKVLLVLGHISGQLRVLPVPGKISVQSRGFTSARANSRPGAGVTPVLGHISGQGGAYTIAVLQQLQFCCRIKR